MTWQGPGFVLAIIAMSYAAWMFTSWVRARNGYPLEGEWGGTITRQDPEADRRIALLSTENETLVGRIGRLEERIAVLERIATDVPTRLSAEIDNLK